jgi:SAM-dependent methyltransferase
MEATQQSDDEQAKLWNGLAGRAWVETQDVLDRMSKPFEELLLAEVAASPCGCVLDVGCGTGGTTVAAARFLGAAGRSVGIDISEPMIAAARARAERERVPASFICANAQDYAFEPAQFDMIISRFGVMFFDRPVAAFANLRRASTADARLRCIAWRSAAENPFMTTAERAAAPLLPDLPPRQPGAPGQFAFGDSHRVQGILEESGWAAIDIQPRDIQCTLPEQDLAFYLSHMGPVGRALHEVDERTRARVMGTVRAAFDPFVDGAQVRFTAACWMIAARAEPV